jgi:hypothetical protein
MPPTTPAITPVESTFLISLFIVNHSFR